jgi:hypothetical protein
MKNAAMRVSRTRWILGAWLRFSLLTLLAGRSTTAQTPPAELPVPTAVGPKSFGTQDYTVTAVSGLSFAPADSSQGYHVSGGLARFGDLNAEQHFYATLDLPPGVIIDYIGFNNLNDGEANVIAIHLWRRNASGSTLDLYDLDNTPHTSWSTDINGSPLGIPWEGSHPAFDSPHILLLDVEIAPNPNYQYFGWVEVWWRRAVSPAPLAASFNDVPTNHPFFQYIEALKASGITGGCSAAPPLYCPDNPVTRGQMAVFLAKALGLHWPAVQ